MQNSQLSDRDIMQLILNEHKYSAQSLTNFVLECSNMELRNEALRALDMTLKHQHHIFELMSQQGWYQPAMADQSMISSAQNMFNQNSSNMQ
ncbi:spore coat protein [Bacillota bacterium LX-D]|nr:spore coat protein [Bacillota bacterium LX-D]